MYIFLFKFFKFKTSTPDEYITIIKKNSQILENMGGIV